MIRANKDDNGAAIELTPIIDMVFLLLIFFLVATTFQQTEREMQVALPTASNAGPISASLREIIINVREDGTLIVSGMEVTPEALGERIETAVEANPEQKVTVRGHRDAPYQFIVQALDVCKGAGIQEPYLDTVIGE